MFLFDLFHGCSVSILLVSAMEVIDSDGMPCAADEYYDGVVEMCSKCSDICPKQSSHARTNHYCIINCPEYHERHLLKKMTAMKNLPDSPNVAKVVTVSHLSERPAADDADALVYKPMFWTSVVALIIAAAATTTLVVLCILRRSVNRSRRSSLNRRRTQSCEPPPLQTKPPFDDHGDVHKHPSASSAGIVACNTTQCSQQALREKVAIENTAVSSRVCFGTSCHLDTSAMTDNFGSSLRASPQRESSMTSQLRESHWLPVASQHSVYALTGPCVNDQAAGVLPAERAVVCGTALNCGSETRRCVDDSAIDVDDDYGRMVAMDPISRVQGFLSYPLMNLREYDHDKVESFLAFHCR